jgi:hypothetical protein
MHLKAGLTLSALGILAAGWETHVDPFEFEKVQLTSEHVANAETAVKSFIGIRDDKTQSQRADHNQSCKAFPGTPSWPGEAAWTGLNKTLSGALLKPVPAASVCWKSTVYDNYDAAQCQAISDIWRGNFSRWGPLCSL